MICEYTRILVEDGLPSTMAAWIFFHINGEHLLNGLYLNKQKSQCQQQTTFYCNHGACFIALTRLEPLIWTEPWPRPEPDPRFWSGAGCRPASGCWILTDGSDSNGDNWQSQWKKFGWLRFLRYDTTIKSICVLKDRRVFHMFIFIKMNLFPF